MPSCGFRKCNNNSKNTNKATGVTFHSFPQDPCCKEKWIKIIQLDQRDEEWLPTKFSRICSAHFKDTDLYVTPLGLRKLKPNAIPAFWPTTETSKDLSVDQNISTLCEVVIKSDPDSIFDTPRKTHLNNQLSIERSKRIQCRRENIKLKKQNRYLKKKNIYLRQLVKSLKKKKLKEDLIEFAVKAEEANKDFIIK